MESLHERHHLSYTHGSLQMLVHEHCGATVDMREDQGSPKATME